MSFWYKLEQIEVVIKKDKWQEQFQILQIFSCFLRNAESLADLERRFDQDEASLLQLKATKKQNFLHYWSMLRKLELKYHLEVSCLRLK